MCSVLIYRVRVLWIFMYLYIYIHITATRSSRNGDLLAMVQCPKKTQCVSILKNRWDTPTLPHRTCRFCPTLRSTESKTTGALETRHTHTRWGATCIYCKVIRTKWMESYLLPLENTIKRMFIHLHPFPFQTRHHPTIFDISSSW